MGMFDRVNFCCPECNRMIEVQSKAGDCILKDYANDRVPANIAIDLKNHHVSCSNCGVMFKIKYETIPAKVKLRLKRV